MQFWPAKVVTPAVSSGRVAASDASSNTIIGVLPPSSRLIRFSVLAAAAAIWRPTGMLLVKLTMSTSADWIRNGAPVLPDSVNMLTTPAGSDGASDTMSAMSALVSAVCPGSFAATVFPAASAGPRERRNSATGAFQGTMIATTPTGSGRLLK